ncbi:hypothetical protein [Tunturiibacter gelidoferens]|uniref:Uncharacterized protein n=3 Tax=Tunturiibacter TaxID=3154218 RepID=A0A7Y9T0T7_9BACT|nr:hypothetical protein [Edaphobacter lichenicola]MBB5341019.1 hypothetical protein [Edaphobacter lichenicola]NYF49663.1 hypothetical protein [Edaphobacter lichenicola]
MKSHERGAIRTISSQRRTPSLAIEFSPRKDRYLEEQGCYHKQGFSFPL